MAGNLIGEYLLTALVGYLLGGVMFSYHIPLRLRGVDVVSSGADHNPGTANAVKHAGVPVGFLCLAADLMKGFLPVRIGLINLDVGHILFALVMVAPVLGHASAPFYRFPGGKAIAVTFGVLLALLPVSDAFWMLAALYLFFSLVVVVRPNERRTLVTFALFMLWALFLRLKQSRSVALGCALISGVVMWKNRRAVEAGEEAETANAS